MTFIEKNEDENYVITISLSEMIYVIFLLFYIKNVISFVNKHDIVDR